MTAPPGLAPTPQPFGELITGTRLDLSTRNGQLRYLMAELGVDRRQAQALIRAYEADERDRLAHVEAVAAGGFSDARAVVRETFRAWLRRGDIMRTPSKVRASSGGWAVTS